MIYLTNNTLDACHIWYSYGSKNADIISTTEMSFFFQNVLCIGTTKPFGFLVILFVSV